MKKSKKLLLAAGTFFPFFYMIAFMLFIFTSIFFAQPGRGGGDLFPAMFLAIIPFHLLAMVLMMAMPIYYIVNAFRNPRVEKDKQVMWAVLLFAFGMLAMPVYWYLYIWRDEEQVSNQTASSAGYNQLYQAQQNNIAWMNQQTATRDRAAEYVPPAQPPDWRGE